MRQLLASFLGLVAGIGTWFLVGSIPNLLGNYGGWAVLFILIIGPLAGCAVFYGVMFYILHRAEEHDKLEQQRAYDIDRRALAAREQQKVRERRIENARQICCEAQRITLSLAPLLVNAELDLDRAEVELTEALYSPFWEAIEDATLKLFAFMNVLQEIATAKETHRKMVEGLSDSAPPFSLDGIVLPDPTVTTERLTRVYRYAQKNHGFARIYEERRVNPQLAARYSSLGDAIRRIGEQMAPSMEKLRSDALDNELLARTIV